MGLGLDTMNGTSTKLNIAAVFLLNNDLPSLMCCQEKGIVTFLREKYCCFL
jgi:hypothetical protein